MHFSFGKIVHSTRRKFAQGFTLVELLVVMSIVTLLIALLMPALGLSRQSANLITCGSNHRQIGIGLAVYTDVFKGNLPLGSMAFNGAAGFAPFYGVQTDALLNGCRLTWDDQISNYLGQDLTQAEAIAATTDRKCQVMICPEDNVPKVSWALGNTRHRRSYAAVCNVPVSGAAFYARGAFDALTDAGDTRHPGLKWPESFNINQFASPSQSISITERWDSSNILGNDSCAVVNCAYEQVKLTVPVTPSPGANITPGYHLGGTFNYLFLDCHVHAYIPVETVGRVESTGVAPFNFGWPQNPRGFWTRVLND